MRYFRWGFLALLAISFPAFADDLSTVAPPCYPAKAAIKELFLNGFIPIAEMDVDNLPAILYVNPRSREYIVLVLNKDVLCKAGSGQSFHLYKMRKA